MNDNDHEPRLVTHDLHKDRCIAAFAHIPKTAGQTLIYLLRRNFGRRHLDVARRLKQSPLDLYRARDLSMDLRFCPGTTSIAGHHLQPHVDMRQSQDRMRWYTFLRDPIKRYISHYLFFVEVMGREQTFDQWLETDPLYRTNTQVVHLTGRQDLDAAQQMLSERFQAVGLLEHFNESLLIFRHRLGLTGFDVRYNRPKNVGRRSDLRDRIMQSFDEYKERIHENNELDMKLYKWVRDELWPRQLSEYGAERLKRDVEREFQGYRPTLQNRRRLAVSFLRRNLLYKPVVHVDRWLQRCVRGYRRGKPTR